jgi:tRNA(Ile)-lysidine synthase
MKTVDPGSCRSYLSACRFPDPADGPVDLAVSGGPDSSALAVLAAAAGLKGTVHHVDHALRPGSEGEAVAVAALARSCGFAFCGWRVSVGEGADLEARARKARYEVLPAGVMTGHTMDDQAETVLLNIMRGAALDGMAGMAPAGRERTSVRRPLLGIRRTDTEEICRLAGARPITDPTNAEPRFRRNRVRHELLPLIADIAEREPVPVLARQAELLAADAALLDEMAGALDPTDARALRSAPTPLARRALRGWLRAGDEAHPPSLAEIERVMEVVRGERVACEVSGGRRVARKAGRLSLTTSRPCTGEPARSTGALTGTAGR